MTFTVGYFVGSLAKNSINRKLVTDACQGFVGVTPAAPAGLRRARFWRGASYAGLSRIASR